MRPILVYLVAVFIQNYLIYIYIYIYIYMADPALIIGAILVLLGVSGRTAMKKQRGGSGEAMGVLILLLILGIGDD